MVFPLIPVTDERTLIASQQWQCVIEMKSNLNYTEPKEKNIYFA